MNAEELRLRPEIEQPGNASTNPAPQAAEPPATASTTHPSPDPVLPSADGRGRVTFDGDDPRAPARSLARGPVPLTLGEKPVVLPADATTLIAPRALGMLIQEIGADRHAVRSGITGEKPDEHEGWNVALIVRTASASLRAIEDGRGDAYRRNLVRVASLAMLAIEEHDKAEAG